MNRKYKIVKHNEFRGKPEEQVTEYDSLSEAIIDLKMIVDDWKLMANNFGKWYGDRDAISDGKPYGYVEVVKDGKDWVEIRPL